MTEARGLLGAGEFPAGSMGPKIEGVRLRAAGGQAVIGALDQATEVVLGAAGTTIVPG